MYTKANIITLTGVLGSGLQNATTMSQFFDDIIRAIGLSPLPIFFNNAEVALVAATTTYNFEAAALKLTDAIMHDSLISMVTEEELDTYSQTWRDAADDTPIALTQDHLSRQYTLYPGPNAAAAATKLTIFYTENKSANFPEYYALPLAFETLFREFSYPSDHQDSEFSESCLVISQFLHAILRGDDVSAN